MSFSAAAHPAVAFWQTLCCVLVTVLMPHPAVVAASLFGAVWFARQMRVRARFFGMLLPFGLLIALTNPLFSHTGGTVWFSLFGLPFTAQAFAYGANMAAMLSAVMIWCRAQAVVLTADKLLGLSGKRLPRLTLTLCMARRWLPLFTASLAESRAAAKTLDMLGGKGAASLKRELRVFSAVVGRSFEDAVIRAQTMEARGYTLEGHTAYAPYRFRRADKICVAAVAATTAAVIAGAACGGGAVVWYPYIALSNAWSDWLVCAAGAGLMLCPSMFEWEEEKRWQRCNSSR